MFAQKRTARLIAGLMLLLSGYTGTVYAGIIEITNRKYLYTVNTATPSTTYIQVTDPDFSQITGNTATFHDKKSTGYLELGIDPDARFCYGEYRRIEVTFGITYRQVNSWDCNDDGSDDTTTVNDIRTLVIDFDPLNRQIYTEKARILFENAYHVTAQVATVLMYDRDNNVVYSGTAYNTLPEDLYWEAGLQIKRYDDFDYTQSPAGFNVSLDNTTDEIVLSWNFQTGAEFYEIEFTHINDYSASGLGTPAALSSLTATFVNNATKVRVNNTVTTYRIPNIFDRGYVIGRIRGIGIGSCTLDKEIPGYWNLPDVPDLTTITAGSYEPVTRHEGTGGNNKNWKLGVSYAEDGKHKEIIEYADGSSRVRQNVTRLSTTEEAVVGETIYDHQGRPTVQVLPVPVESPVIKYYQNFNLALSDGLKLSREHFDTDDAFGTDGCIPSGPDLMTTSGAAYYYSADNTYQSDAQAFVPESKGYPYTQVFYTPDNTGRVRMQSGVGSFHVMGSGHETKYFYGKPSQAELDRLFGTNAGYRSHYQKNMVIDANGQVSVSFVDMNGKTIATSLAGSAPLNTNELPGAGGAAEEMTIDLLGDVTAQFPNGEDNHLSVDGTVWSHSSTLLVEYAQHYRFSYSVELKDYLDACLNATCFDCVYDLEIDILDACNVSVLDEPYTVHLGGTTADTICNEDQLFEEDTLSYPDFSQYLEVGNYTVTKRLVLDENVIGYYTEKYIENNTCLLTWEDFFEMPDTSGCFFSCEECLEELGDSLDFYALYPDISLPELRAIYQSKKAMCDGICDNSENDLCRTAYKSMLRDMGIGGQYASQDPNDRLSIYHDDLLLPDYTNTSDMSGAPYQRRMDAWRFPHYFDIENPSAYTSSANAHYFDDDGQQSRIAVDQDLSGNWTPAVVNPALVVTDPNGSSFTTPENLQNEADFISRFRASWAKSLVVYHPEFLHLTNCLDITNAHQETIGSATYDMWQYDALLQGLQYSGVPSASPVITDPNAFDPRENDPFFVQFGSATLLPGFTVNDYFDLMAENYVILPTETLDIWEYSHVVNICPISNPAFVGPGCTGSLAMNMNGGAYINTQQEWERLVYAYLAIKQKIFFAYMFTDMYINDQNITNLCIGVPNYDAANLPHTVHPWLPCDLVEYHHFAEKDPRFGRPEAIYNDGTFDPSPPSAEQLLAYGQQQVYQTTGKCPLAMDLQTMLYGIADADDLTNTVDLENAPYLMPGLYTAIANMNSGSVPDYLGVVTGSVLEWDINGTDHITMTLPAGYNWSNVSAISNVTDVVAAGPEFQFAVDVQVFNTTTSEVEWIEVTGSTTIPIGDCENDLPKLCKVTQEAKDLKSLMAELKANGALNSSTSLAAYASYITVYLKHYLGDSPASSYTWSNPVSGQYVLTNTSTSKTITVTIDPSDISTFAGGTFLMSTIGGDIGTSPVVTATSNFIIEGYTDAVLQLLSQSPDVSIEGSVTSTPPFRVSECDNPPSAGCNTTEHRNYYELRDLLEMQPFLNTGCVTSLMVDGIPQNLPSSYTIVSLEPDMEYSEDGVTSDHFILVIEVSGPTEITYNGTYCKPLRMCGGCVNIFAPSCDDLYYTFDFSNATADIEDINDNGTLVIGLPEPLDGCYEPVMDVTFTPLTEMTAPYTIPAILAEWALKLNNSTDGSFLVQHYPGSTSLVLVLRTLNEAGCKCDDAINNPAQVTMTVEGGPDGYVPIRVFGTGVCCDEYTVPVQDNGWEMQPPLVISDPCNLDLTPFDTIPPAPGNPCVESLMAAATFSADNAYNEYLESVRAAFRADYIAKCMDVTESFRVQFVNMQYHFTLYYYDQAGNLVKTVPPEAVQPIAFASLGSVTSARNGNSTYLPVHDQVNGNNNEKLTTKYWYNTLNQPRFQHTPDGGKTSYIYDALGRITLSRNARQLPDNRWSYTLYDPLGRIYMNGEFEESSPMTQDLALTYTDMLSYTSGGTDYRDIIFTLYDQPYGVSGIVQHELRNRVSYTIYQDVAAGLSYATYYSYDIHGNVKTLWQENPEIPDVNHQLKKLEYEYDLVSGKVNKVTYQPGAQDQWIHRYSYDADNRLTVTETSRDGIFYDRDASYFYYKHGPLSRQEYGELNVQGTDYTYTMHGWIKAVNATNLDPDLDMGHDAQTSVSGVHRYFARDVHSFVLHYYNGDYGNISHNTSFIGNAATNNISYNSLYNGNIAMMQTTITDNVLNPVPLMSRYEYDQLNRLAKAEYNADIDLSTNTWNDNFDNRHKNEFTYDANGNIGTQLRNGEAGNLPMDNLVYHYETGSNKLDWVQDLETGSTYTDDIDAQMSNNYGYDPIGNLVRDDAEFIDNIEWTHYGKINAVIRQAGNPRPSLEFSYNAAGNRITKKVDTPAGTDAYYYFHDATGNIMAIYKYSTTVPDDMILEEQMMYGSVRIGSVILKEKLEDPAPGTEITYVQKRGQKRYELNNHLGNVLAVISDRRKLDCGEESFTADLMSNYDYSPFGAIFRNASLEGQVCTESTSTVTDTVTYDTFTASSMDGWNEISPASATSVLNSMNVSCSTAVSGWGIIKNVPFINGNSYSISFTYAPRGITRACTEKQLKVIARNSSGSIMLDQSFNAGGTYTFSFAADETGIGTLELVLAESSNCPIRFDDILLTTEQEVTEVQCTPRCSTQTVTSYTTIFEDDFEDGNANGWLYAEEMTTPTVSGGAMEVFSLDNQSVVTTFTPVPGKTYRITASVDVNGCTNSQFLVGDPQSPQIVTIPASGQVAYNWTATVSPAFIGFYTFSPCTQIDVDWVKIEELSDTTIEVCGDSTGYRFGFNGQEKDNEIYGPEGTSYTAEFWQYDPRISRRWNIDPIVKEWESPYLCFRGNPITYKDMKGDDPINGYKEKRQEAIVKRDQAKNQWMDLKENPVDKANKEDYAQYKQDLKRAKSLLTEANSEYNKVNRAFEHVEMQLNDFAWTDPTSYNDLFNLRDPNDPNKKIDIYFFTSKKIDNAGHVGVTDMIVTTVTNKSTGYVDHYEFGSATFGASTNKIAVTLLDETNSMTVAHEKIHVLYGLMYPQMWVQNQGEYDADIEEKRYGELMKQKGARPQGWVRPR